MLLCSRAVHVLGPEVNTPFYVILARTGAWDKDRLTPSSCGNGRVMRTAVSVASRDERRAVSVAGRCRVSVLAFQFPLSVANG